MRISNLIPILPLALVLGCQSTQSDGRRSAPRRQTPQVTVLGADAKVEADGSITLNYPEEEDFNNRVPEWVINPAVGGVTGAVGVASTSSLGTREQLDAARWNGRAELASMLELRIQRVARSELEENQRVEGGRDAGLARRDSLSIDRAILDQVLAGTRQRALWWDEDTGEVFVWMVVDGALLERVSHRVIEDVSVFTAAASVPNEYRPQRQRPQPPTVIVEMPDAPEPAPQPEPLIEPAAPKTSTEKLEDALKPIETIPSKETEEDDE